MPGYHDVEEDDDGDDGEDVEEDDHDDDDDGDLRSHLSPSSFAFSNKFLKGDKSIMVLEIGGLNVQSFATFPLLFQVVNHGSENRGAKGAAENVRSFETFSWLPLLFQEMNPSWF